MQCCYPSGLLTMPWVQRQGGEIFSPVYSIPHSLFRKCFYLFGGEYPPFMGKNNSLFCTLFYEYCGGYCGFSGTLGSNL